MKFYLGMPYEDVYFSRHEITTMRWLIKGLTNKETAKELGISPRSVEHYVGRMRDKTGCCSKSHLIREFLKTELGKNTYKELIFS